MDIQLTSQQQQVMDIQEDNLPRVVDPRTHTTYILVPEVDSEAIRELLEDEHRQEALHVEDAPRFLNRIEAARNSIRAGKGIRLEEL